MISRSSIWRRRPARRGVSFVAMAAITAAALATSVGFADPKPAKPAAHAKAAHGKKSTSTKAQTDGGASDTTGASSASTSGTSGGTGSDSSDAGVVTSKAVGDGGAKVFRFGELEIEGRLKSPQLVYFLRRVRAEFSAGDLGHRSFFPELSETEGDPSFGGGTP